MAIAKPKKHCNGSDWVGFPTSTFLNPIPSAYNFTNPLSKTVLLIADNDYVSKHVASYLDTTLHVSGFKVTKFTSISSHPLLWTKNIQTHYDENKTDEFWQYKLNLSDFDCIVIPSQIHGDVWNALSDDTKLKFQLFVQNGGCLICCHFRATNIINSVCDIQWHEISVKIGASYHIKKHNDILLHSNDVRGIVNIDKDDIIYKTHDDFTTVALRKYRDGCCYYIGHDFSAIWEKTWNKILFQSIKKILTNSDKDIMNLSFGNIDIEAFKNLNIETNKNEIKDIYLEEFEPDFKCMDDGVNEDTIDDVERKDNGEIHRSFDGFEDLQGFDDMEEELSPQTGSKYQSIGYVQMNDDGVITMNDGNRFKVEIESDDVVEINYNTKTNHLDTIKESDNDDDEEDYDESLEEVD